MAFLRDPNLFNRIEEDLEELGYVGESVNKQLMYLAASSRKMESPISIIVHSQSASGKSYLIDTVKKLMPPEDVVSLTSLSDQALNYMEDEALWGKFLTLGEAVHSEAVEYQLREMLSCGELSRLVTTKDEKSGGMMSRMVRKKVKVTAVMSTTSERINEENASRCFLISTDESQSQTQAIQRRQRQKYSLEAYRKRESLIPSIIRRHQAAQRLLEPRMIINSFAEHLEFPSSQRRTRRDHERFIDLIAAVCFLRQHQRSAAAFEPYLECDIEDYRIAHQIISQILPGVLTSLPKSAGVLYGQIQELAEKKATAESLSLHEVLFTQREIREGIGASHDVVKRNLRYLVEYEYIETRGGRSGSRYRYRLSSTPPVGAGAFDTLPDPVEMQRRIALKSQSGVEAGPCPDPFSNSLPLNEISPKRGSGAVATSES